MRLGCALAAILWLSSAAADDIDGRLQLAEAHKRTELALFASELDALDALKGRLNPRQAEHLAYLRAWQRTYAGDFEAAVPQFQRIIESGEDPVIRFRSRVTLLNALTLSRRYADSFEQLSVVLDQLDSIGDDAAESQALGAAAQLLNQVAQYQESLRYSTRLLQESTLPWARCGAAQLQFESKVKSGLMTTVDGDLERWADECGVRGEPVFSGLMRTYIARLHLQNGQPERALAALNQHLTAIRETRYPLLIADVASKRATAYLAIQQLPEAERSAQEAIDLIKPGQIVEALPEAWRVRYQVAEQRGDYVGALRALERYQAADRAYLDDIGQRALAFELARHQARAKSFEIASLNQQNQLLQLEQQISTQSVRNARLSSVLLLSVLILAVVFALRTRKLKRHYQLLAQQDSLTGVASRPHFMDEAARLLDQLRRQGRPAALLLMDLDHFKNVNDRHGHAVGDEVLRSATAASRAHLRPQDLYGRLGGEEFALLLPGLTPEQALALAERCRLALVEVRFGGEGERERLSASFGLACTADSGHQLHHLLIDADRAMYRAKHQGRNCVVRHLPEAESNSGPAPAGVAHSTGR
ncbi:MAG: GGDEF domain-containing protein [Lysobacterales bacterium]